MGAAQVRYSCFDKTVVNDTSFGIHSFANEIALFNHDHRSSGEGIKIVGSISRTFLPPPPGPLKLSRNNEKEIIKSPEGFASLLRDIVDKRLIHHSFDRNTPFAVTKALFRAERHNPLIKSFFCFSFSFVMLSRSIRLNCQS